MKQRGWTQSDLARAAKLSRQVINNYVNGRRRPNARAIEALSRAFKCSPERVMRAAGFELPDELGESEEKEILYIYRNLSGDKRKIISRRQ